MPNHKYFFYTLLGLLLFFIADPLFAQSNSHENPYIYRPLNHAYDRVALVTIGSGSEIYELFGHNAILLINSETDDMRIVNYGMFDFEEPGFVTHFIQGKLMYWLDVGDNPDRELGHYVKNNRPVVVQNLNLSKPQIDRLVDLLNQQTLPENYRYLYDYFTCNCSTKVRDALDLALNGRIQDELAKKPANTSYRQQVRRLTHNHYFLYTALYFVFGPAADKPISQWEDSFLPVQFQEDIQNIQIPGPDGKPIPLVKNHYTLGKVPLMPLEQTKTHFGIQLCFSIPLSALIIFLTYKKHRWIPALLAVPWMLLCAIAGGLLTWVYSTLHSTTFWNINVLLFPPTVILLLIIWFPLILGKLQKHKKIIPVAKALLVAQLVPTLLALLIKPFHPQVNLEMFALAIPLNFALYYAGRKAIYVQPA